MQVYSAPCHTHWHGPNCEATQAEDDICVIDQRKASKQRRAQKRQLVGDEEETVVGKKPKEPPRPEPLLRPLRPEDSEEDVSEEEPAAK